MAAKSGSENWGRVAADTVPVIIEKVRAKGAGRPLVYEREQTQAEIVTRLCTGESLPMICKGPLMPALSTVNGWIAKDDGFSTAIANARLIGTDTLVDACYSIAAGDELSTGSIERDKLLCSVIKWIVAKRDPANSPNNWRNIIIVGPEDTDLL